MVDLIKDIVVHSKAKHMFSCIGVPVPALEQAIEKGFGNVVRERFPNQVHNLEHDVFIERHLMGGENLRFSHPEHGNRMHVFIARELKKPQEISITIAHYHGTELEDFDNFVDGIRQSLLDLK